MHKVKVTRWYESESHKADHAGKAHEGSMQTVKIAVDNHVKKSARPDV